MDNTQTINTLNNLIETCKDGEQGFRTAAEGISDPQIKALFGQYARQRGQMARELQDEVEGLGGEPEHAGSLAGSAHRGWINIKSVVTGKNDQMIIAEAERGEDVAKAMFESALTTALPAQVLALVQRIAVQVRETHDRVRAMEKTAAR